MHIRFFSLSLLGNDRYEMRRTRSIESRVKHLQERMKVDILRQKENERRDILNHDH